MDTIRIKEQPDGLLVVRAGSRLLGENLDEEETLALVSAELVNSFTSESSKDGGKA